MDPEVRPPRRSERGAEQAHEARTHRLEAAVEGEKRGLAGPVLTIACQHVQQVMNAPAALDEPLTVRTGEDFFETRGQPARLKQTIGAVAAVPHHRHVSAAERAR